jgi:hypothetical protein
MDSTRGDMNQQDSTPGGIGDQSFGQAKQSAMSQAKAKLDQVASTTEDRARSAATTGKNTAVDTLNGLAQSLSIAGQQLRDQHNRAGDLVSQAAGRVDRVAQFLDRSDVNDLARRSEDWARRNPALFLGAAFALGLLGARFLKASPPATRNLPSTDVRSSASRFSDREVAVPVTEG